VADDWQPELDELRRRETFAERLGGAERVKRQHDEGRLTIRRRIARLVDPDTFSPRVGAERSRHERCLLGPAPTRRGRVGPGLT